MTVDNPEVEGENTDGDADGATHVGEGVATPNRTMQQYYKATTA
jgi:hypothetical protein